MRKFFLYAMVAFLAAMAHSSSAADRSLPAIGAQVFIEPGQTKENIEGWFDTLAQAGMQVCRIRLHESHVNNDGKWDFSLYDFAFDCAQRNGIKVFVTLFPNDSKRSVGGEKFPESRKHFKEVGIYIDKAVEHYKNHPALYAWVIQNEPGVGGVIPDNEFTDHARAQWQKRCGKSGGEGFIKNSYDEEKFLLAYETWYLGWMADRIRKQDKVHDLHLNNHQIFCNVAEYDFVAWRSFLSTLGASAHPSWHYGYFTRDQYPMAMAANCNVIRSGAGELPYWVTELQAGNNLYSGNIPICPTSDEITQWLWTCIGNGAEGVVFWSLNPRSATGEPGEWALLTLDHKPSERFEAAREVVSVLKENENVFATADKLEVPVTVLYNRESLWAEKKMQHGGVRQDEGRSPGAVMKEALGLYQACTENGIIPAMSEIREFDWEKGDYTGQMLIVANQVALPDEYAGKLERFVSLGGKLVVTGLTGFWGSDNVCLACTDFIYKDLFGGEFKDVRYVGDEFDIVMNDPAIALPSHMWMSSLSLSTATGAAVCGDEAVCARNSYGNGEVLWIPSLVGLGKRRNADMGLASLLQTELAEISLPVRFAFPAENLLMNTLECADGLVTVIINKGQKPVVMPLTAESACSPEVLYSSHGGDVLAGSIANLHPEETIVVKWSLKK